MKYDFTSILDRCGRDAIAVDGLKGDGFSPAPPKAGFDAIPMWVADMNFPTVPTIQEAIIERTNHPAFGYFNPTDEYFDSIIRWQAKRNGVVKYRRDEHEGDPAEAVDARKQARILRTARYYMTRYHISEDTPCRFDVVAVLGSNVRLIRDAFWCG